MPDEPQGLFDKWLRIQILDGIDSCSKGYRCIVLKGGKEFGVSKEMEGAGESSAGKIFARTNFFGNYRRDILGHLRFLFATDDEPAFDRDSSRMIACFRMDSRRIYTCCVYKFVNFVNPND